MKELKFRAWWKDTKRFLDGDEWYMTCSGAKHLHYSIYPYSDDDFVIEQYTGLKDKNGKEIYEGDIMIFDACLYKVVWNEEYAGFDYETIGEWGVTSTNVFNEGAVIGNIHENADLLEDK